jgi:hypothetical protein
VSWSGTSKLIRVDARSHIEDRYIENVT